MIQDLGLSNHVLGETAGPVRLQGRSAIRAACALMAAQTNRELRIFSRDLDPPLYDNRDFLEPVRQLALSSQHAIVRILLIDIEPAVRRGHRLVELARVLTSRVQIRRASDEFEHQAEAYLTADDKGYVVRPRAELFEGTMDFFAPVRARLMHRNFERVWERSSRHQDLIAFGRGL